ncbi:MAG: hypothetical protein QM714_10315 [Nocardioides sp.]|uniref:hypothetical protein n=1 Tax=Nocardioides sp. TaxID=35761 RepID=UPI0039E64CF0
MIAVATAAPALAASGVAGTLVMYTFNGWTGENTLIWQAKVTNMWSSTTPTTGAVTLLVSFDDALVTGELKSMSGSDWTSSAPVQSGSKWIYSFTYGATIGVSQDSTLLQFTVSRDVTASGSFTVDGVASASNMTPATKSETFAV